MIIGAGPRWSEIAESIERNGDTNITLLPLQAESVLPFSLATADIALVSLETGMEGISMPSKTYYCMAAGAAIVGICPERSDLAYVIREHDCGASIAPGDADGLARIIDRLSASPNELARLRRNARTAAVQTFSRDVNTRTVRETLMQLAIHTEAKTCGDRAR
jgi:glycosyltransferase involved in cell wall biosynthesis